MLNISPTAGRAQRRGRLPHRDFARQVSVRVLTVEIVPTLSAADDSLIIRAEIAPLCNSALKTCYHFEDSKPPKITNQSWKDNIVRSFVRSSYAQNALQSMKILRVSFYCKRIFIKPLSGALVYSLLLLLLNDMFTYFSQFSKKCSIVVGYWRAVQIWIWMRTKCK